VSREDFTMPTFVLSRRQVVLAGAMLPVIPGLCGLLASCTRRDTRPAVTLVTSVDAGVIEPIIATLTDGAPYAVNLLTDTEATKTTGLVAMLIEQHQRAASAMPTPGTAASPSPAPRLWWSGDVLGSMALARAGVLEPMASPILSTRLARTDAPRDDRNRWFALAPRPRCLVVNTRNLAEGARPRSLAAALMQSRKFNQPLAIANPAFGTTRGHVAALLATLGRDRFTELLGSGTYRQVDGNSAVVRAVSAGENVMGLTDYDDVAAGLANGWPIAPVFLPLAPDDEIGPCLATHSSVGLLAGPSAASSSGPNYAIDLAERIISARCEALLAASIWRSMPPSAAASDPAASAPADPLLQGVRITWPNWTTASEVQAEALAIASAAIGASPGSPPSAPASSPR
jgi:hypothetical protein